MSRSEGSQLRSQPVWQAFSGGIGVEGDPVNGF